MDSVSGAVEAAIGLQQANLSQQIEVALLRKAMDAEKAQAQALLSALPPPPQGAPLTPGCGERVDLYA